MSTYKVVVDGSNIATEGRTKPSLNQLDEAVRAFIEEHPGADVLVIVDSSFPNRIEQSELAIFESAYGAGEIITPPAGTIGRGDSFILKVAEKLNATVFSNDSFQEFHGEYDWLFEKGRLVGGKPIPGAGMWVFTPRTPVRGPKSREAMRDAKRTRVRVGSKEASVPMPRPKAPPPFMLKQVADHALAIAEVAAEGDSKRGRRKRASRKEEAVAAAVLAGAVDAADDRKRKKKRRRKGGVERPIESMNDALPFLTFVAAHTIGSTLDGEVLEYSSHGFFVAAGGVRCYVPLIGLAEPTPRSAKEVVRRGDTRSWLVRSFDPARRSIELALVGTPSAATVVVPEGAGPEADTAGPGRARKAAKKVAGVAKAAKRTVSGGRAQPAAAAVEVAPTTVSPVSPAGRPVRRGRAATAPDGALGGVSAAAAALATGAESVTAAVPIPTRNATRSVATRAPKSAAPTPTREAVAPVAAKAAPIRKAAVAKVAAKATTGKAAAKEATPTTPVIAAPKAKGKASARSSVPANVVTAVPAAVPTAVPTPSAAPAKRAVKRAAAEAPIPAKAAVAAVAATPATVRKTAAPVKKAATAVAKAVATPAEPTKPVKKPAKAPIVVKKAAKAAKKV